MFEKSRLYCDFKKYIFDTAVKIMGNTHLLYIFRGMQKGF